jgi:uncharacterized UPF0160 family protein
MNTIKTIVSHSGIMHADEITAVAILYVLQGTMPAIIRTREPSLLVSASDTLVIDVGGKYDPDNGYYDHHQRDFTVTHPEGSPKASAGLLWETYGNELCSKLNPSLDTTVAFAASELVRKELILPVDSIDTGHVRPKEGEYHFSHVVSSFNQKDIFSAEQDEAFVTAVKFVATILENVFMNALAKATEHRKVLELIKVTEGNTLVLPEFLDWEPLVKEYNEQNPTYDYIAYTVFPSGGEYRIRAVGERDYFNSDYSYVSPKVFIHKVGFIAGTKTLTEALALIGEHCALRPY